MKLLLELGLACLFGSIWIRPALCDEVSTASGLNNWTCTCSSSDHRNETYIKHYCSTSCDCNPVARVSSGGSWTCECALDGFPTIASSSNGHTCFSACNCTSGSFHDVPAKRKHFPGKVVVIILLLCVILTALAFLASISCCVYRNHKCPFRSPIFSPDREIVSYNRATNLMSNRGSSESESRVSFDTRSHSILGYFRWGSFTYSENSDVMHSNIVRFSFSELEHATKKFSNANLIGTGGSSHVYRGQLRNGKTVAIKRLKAQGGPDADSLFSKEVEVLSRLYHCHVVPLLGYCSEFPGKRPQRLLVFEDMPNGNLRDCLDGISGESILWDTRVAIALGAARGLEYLHEAAAPRILHRDVKSTNILLDENWRAKITDFGMAKCLRDGDAPSIPSSPARMQGTFGYFAPECAMVGRASLMSDVFSFGVVLLELITGRQPIHKSTNKGEESLVIWATSRLQDSRRVIAELPDPRLKGDFPVEEMQIMAYLAKECLLLDPDTRPTMGEVVQVLSSIALSKSRRRSIPVNLFQMSFSGSLKMESEIQKPEAELRRETSGKQSAPSSMLSDMVQTVSIGQNTSEVDAVSSKYIERLILLTSNARSWGTTDGEAVDLTEPRLESFRMANFVSA